MNNIQIFNNPEFGEIRTVVIDDEPWFMGKDVAAVLRYGDGNEKSKALANAISDHVDEDDKKLMPYEFFKGLQNGDLKNISHYGAIIINESGLYSLIFGSKLSSAKKFKKWVTSEVLPAIRKTGSYGKQLPQNPIELLELHYEAIRHVDNKVDTLAEDLEQFKQELPLFGMDEDKITTAAHKKGAECLGGKNSNAYNDNSIRGKVFRDIYNEMKRQFGIRGTYKQLKRNQCDKAVSVIEQYQLPMYLEEQIRDCNAQLNIEEMETKEKEQTQ
jgi:prophage antirepressor-like protein